MVMSLLDTSSLAALEDDATIHLGHMLQYKRSIEVSKPTYKMFE